MHPIAQMYRRDVCPPWLGREGVRPHMVYLSWLTTAGLIRMGHESFHLGWRRHHYPRRASDG